MPCAFSDVCRLFFAVHAINASHHVVIHVRNISHGPNPEVGRIGSDVEPGGPRTRSYSFLGLYKRS